MGSIGMTGEEPVFAAYNKGANGIFGNIVIRLEQAVFRVDRQFVPILQSIIDSLAQEAFWWRQRLSGI